MKKTQINLFTTAAILSCGFLLTGSTASATVLGNMALGSGSSNVVVTNNTIHFNGMFSVTGPQDATGTNLTFDSPIEQLTVGTTGQINSLTFGSLSGFTNFITFNDSIGTPSATDLKFNLAAIGYAPGTVTNTCSAVQNNVCAIDVNSPIVLLNTASGVTASLSVAGTATDNTGMISTFIGTFSQPLTTCPGCVQPGVLNDLEIQNYFDPGGNPNSVNNSASLSSPYSGTFTVSFTSVPEPSSMAMMFIGSSLLLFAVSRRRANR